MIPKSDVSIRQFAPRSRLQTTEDFDACNQDALKEALEQLNGPYAFLLWSIIENTALVTFDDYEVHAILNHAVNILVSALQMVRQRTRTEAYALMRIALEAAATAFQISRDPDARCRYLANKFQSCEAISFARKVLPIVGDLWGGMINCAIHPNPIGFGPQPEEKKSGQLTMSVKMFLGTRKQPKWQDELSLIFMCLIANVVLKLMTLAARDESRWMQMVVGVGPAFLLSTDLRICGYEQAAIRKIEEVAASAEGQASSGDERL